MCREDDKKATQGAFNVYNWTVIIIVNIIYSVRLFCGFNNRSIFC